MNYCFTNFSTANTLPSATTCKKYKPAGKSPAGTVCILLSDRVGCSRTSCPVRPTIRKVISAAADFGSSIVKVPVLGLGESFRFEANTISVVFEMGSKMLRPLTEAPPPPPLNPWMTISEKCSPANVPCRHAGIPYPKAASFESRQVIQA